MTCLDPMLHHGIQEILILLTSILSSCSSESVLILLQGGEGWQVSGKSLDHSDLVADPVVMFQHRLDPWFAQFVCFVFPALIAKHFWGEMFWNALFVAGAPRYCIVLHFTWCVNSLAHFYGGKPYDENIWPAENLFVSIGAIGEGWHNWHHKYPFDYAASEFGISKQFNPSKAWIDFFAMIGQVTNRKRATGAWEKLKQSRAKAAAAGQETSVKKEL